MGYHCLDCPTYIFPGGTGGEGGGGTIAGEGGIGGKAIIKGDKLTLLSKSQLPGPHMTIGKFGVKFSISKNMVKKLSDTAGSLHFATIIELKEDGFKHRQVNQLKHVLDIWSLKST